MKKIDKNSNVVIYSKPIKPPRREFNNTSRRIKNNLMQMMAKISLDLKRDIGENDSLSEMINKANKAVDKHAGKFVASALFLSSVLIGRVSKNSKKYSGTIISDFVKKINNRYQGKEALEQITKLFKNSSQAKTDAKIDKIVNQCIKDNVSLIKTLPETVKERLASNIADHYQKGNLVTSHIQEIVKESSKLAAYRVQLIAQHQSKLLNKDICEQVLKSVGVEYYEWRHSGISKEPRIIHLELNGSTQSWNDPPISNPQGGRHHPAEEIGCNCYAVPMLILGDKK